MSQLHKSPSIFTRGEKKLFPTSVIEVMQFIFNWTEEKDWEQRLGYNGYVMFCFQKSSLGLGFVFGGYRMEYSPRVK